MSMMNKSPQYVAMYTGYQSAGSLLRLESAEGCLVVLAVEVLLWAMVAGSE
jgi:hypothetical protein